MRSLHCFCGSKSKMFRPWSQCWLLSNVSARQLGTLVSSILYSVHCDKEMDRLKWIWQLVTPANRTFWGLSVSVIRGTMRVWNEFGGEPGRKPTEKWVGPVTCRRIEMGPIRWARTINVHQGHCGFVVIGFYHHLKLLFWDIMGIDCRCFLIHYKYKVWEHEKDNASDTFN